MELGQGGVQNGGGMFLVRVWASVRTLEAVTRGQVTASHLSDSVVVTSGHSQGLQSPGPQTCSDSSP